MMTLQNATSPNAARDRALMPLPRTVRWGVGPLLPAGSSLRVRYAGVRTERIDAALARWQSVWAGMTCRSDLQIAMPSDSGRDLEIAPAGRADRDREVARAVQRTAELVIDCVATGARFPALGDDESYRLEIRPDRIVIRAPLEWGIVRGFATLTQLAVGCDGLAPVVIADAPRFGWRGLTLDVARHFIGIERLLATLDAMALCKLNVLHLHLTDDQGFRFPSSAYPRLASERAFTREELARLVTHAADLGIRVVPELDMPGHSTSWLTAHPEWGCRPAEPSRRFGVHRACLDPTNPAVLVAIDTLLGELAEVFPDAYLHIGGDEVHPEWWSSTPAVRDWMAEHGIATPADLQAQFNRRVVERVTALGRRTIGWDEVLHPDLPAEVTVQTWRGATARDRARAGGHDCVISANYYLDLFYPADVHYGFDPEAPHATLLAREDALEADPRLAHVAAGMRWTRHWREAADGRPGCSLPPGRVLGAEACLWAELVDEATLDIRLWSRLPALAERFWSPAAVRDVPDMRRRLSGCLDALAATGMDIRAASQAFVTRAGVGPAWQPLAAQLEPVKWYARLLGQDALAARIAGREMPLARPYQADTPLDRVVDGLLPESPVVLDLEGLCGRLAADPGRNEEAAQLRALAATWCAIPRSGAGPAELESLAERLAAIGRIVVDVLDGRLARPAARAALVPLADPVGEYVIAAVPVLARWLAESR